MGYYRVNYEDSVWKQITEASLYIPDILEIIKNIFFNI